MSYTYTYPRPMVTVDMMLVRFRNDRLEVLLIRRDRPPFEGRWAIPGGFVEMNEPLEAAARRELQEETGLSEPALAQLWTAGDPGRDPRGRTISVLFGGLLAPPFPQARAGDDAREVRWFSFAELPPLAFDHETLLQRGLDILREHSLWRLWAFLLLDTTFSCSQLESLGTALWGTGRFTARLLEMGGRRKWVTRLGENRYRRNASSAEILDASFSSLLKSWEEFF